MGRNARGRKSNPGGGNRRRDIVAQKHRLVWTLHLSHYGSYREIADHSDVRLSHAQVGAIIRNCRVELKHEIGMYGQYAADERLVGVRDVKRESRDMMSRPCPICDGTGREDQHAPCGTCAATGRFYEAEDRMRGAALYLKALMEEARLLGELEPDQVEHTINLKVVQELAALSEEQLEQFIEAHEIDGVWTTEPRELAPEPAALDSGEQAA